MSGGHVRDARTLCRNPKTAEQKQRTLPTGRPGIQPTDRAVQQHQEGIRVPLITRMENPRVCITKTIITSRPNRTTI
ncbi:hypothetical protein BU16DRAFT_521825 [Lophium mytilinum]|uniref:Uncharacterized protein n=1 Tax=Lophium mytilinum TaxID=390894 RepID=A0A6A6REW8_9PEZI|nr:hypothetical protein BU16DRAFT_521825 [Lophium mytilinum]